MTYDFKKFRSSITFVAKLYKLELQPNQLIPRADVVGLIDTLMKENNKPKSRFSNVRSVITHYDNKTGVIHLKVIAINMRVNDTFGIGGGWAYANSRFVRQNDLFIREWFDNSVLGPYYYMNIMRTYDLATEWKMEESTEAQFEDIDEYNMRERLREYFSSKSNKEFWDKYHYVYIKNKRYFDIKLANLMFTFNMNIASQLYKYRWKTYEHLNREFPINFYKKKISGSEIKSLTQNAEMEFSFNRKENELVIFNTCINIHGLFNVNSAEWGIINNRVKFYEDQDEYDRVKLNLHYSAYENRSNDIIDRYIWLSTLYNFTGMDNILLKGE